MTAPDSSGENLTDDDLQSEIELVGDLVVAAPSSTSGRTPSNRSISSWVSGPVLEVAAQA